jgi:hypothetical protein
VRKMFQEEDSNIELPFIVYLWNLILDTS